MMQPIGLPVVQEVQHFTDPRHDLAGVQETAADIARRSRGHRDEHRHGGPDALANYVSYEIEKIIYLRDYVVGNGIVDDTAGIRNAIRAANSGDWIYVSNGTYIISDHVHVDKPLKFFGPGTFKLADGTSADTYMFLVDADIPRGKFQGLNFNGNKANVSSLSNYGLYFSHGADNWEVSGNYFFNFPADTFTGAPIGGNEDFDSVGEYVIGLNIHDNVFRDNDGYALYLEGGCPGTKFCNNYVADGKGVKINIDSRRCDVSHNEFVTLTDGIAIELWTASGDNLIGCHESTVIGNRIYEAPFMGISIANANRCTVSSNTIRGGCSYTGIEVADSRECTVSSNTIYDVDGTGIVASSQTDDGIQDNIYNHNVIYNFGGQAGIYFYSEDTDEAYSRTKIHGNIIHAGARGIYAQGSVNTTVYYLDIQGNTIYQTDDAAIYLEGDLSHPHVCHNIVLGSNIDNTEATIYIDPSIPGAKVYNNPGDLCGKVFKSAPETTNNDTSLGNDADLFVKVEDDVAYSIRLLLDVTTDVTAGIKVNFSTPGGTIQGAWRVLNDSGTTAADAVHKGGSNVAVTAVNAAAVGKVEFTGIYLASAKGTLYVQWAQNVGIVADLTINKGSWLEVERL